MTTAESEQLVPTGELEWEEGALKLLEHGPGHGPLMYRAALEDAARRLGKRRVTKEMVRDVCEDASSWGWEAVFAGSERSWEWEDLYAGFSGARDANEAASRMAAADDSLVESDIDFLVDIAGLSPGASVLDLGCGQGRLSIALAKRGFEVTGLDLSEQWLAVARAYAEHEGVDVRFVPTDLRDPPWKGIGAAAFDVAISAGVLFDTFSVFPESDAPSSLNEVQRLLKPGGFLFVCYAWDINFALRTAMVEPGGTAVVKSWFFDGSNYFSTDGAAFLFEDRYRVVDGQQSLYRRLIQIGRDGARRECRGVDRVYTPDELIKLVGEAGLVSRGHWSHTYPGYTEYNPTSGKLALLAQKG